MKNEITSNFINNSQFWHQGVHYLTAAVLTFLSLFPSSHLLLCLFLVTFLISLHQNNHKKIPFPLNERQSFNITLACLLTWCFRFSKLYISKGKEKGLLTSFNYSPPDIYKFKQMHKNWNAKEIFQALLSLKEYLMSITQVLGTVSKDWYLLLNTSRTFYLNNK